MGQTEVAFLAVSRATLKQDFLRLVKPPHDDRGQEVYTEWSTREDPGTPLGKSDYLLEFVELEKHFTEHQRDKRASLTLSLKHPQYPDRITEVNISYRGYLQDMYNAELDMAFVTVRDANARNNALFNLFHPSMKPAFFHILNSLSIIFGYEATHEGLSEYNRDINREHWLSMGLFPYKAIEITRRNFLIVGKPLVPYFGLEKLRKAETFAHWELESGSFIYAYPYYFYEAWEPGEPAVKVNEFSADEVWSESTEFKTYDEVWQAATLSWQRLEEGLGLPITIPYQPRT